MFFCYSKKQISRFAGISFQLHRRRLCSAVAVPPFNERKVKVLDAQINIIETVEEKVGNAPAIFFLPGLLGSIELDFKPMMPDLDREKYKWISWDPPGVGKSVPPKKKFSPKELECMCQHDVKYIGEIMNILGHPKYNILAWSGAGVSAMFLAVEQPEKVSSLITLGAIGYVATEVVPRLRVMKQMGLDAVPEPRRGQLLSMYGEEYLLQLWHGYFDKAISMPYSREFKEGGTFQQVLKKVACPTLIIHGGKDALVHINQAQHLHAAIKNSRFQEIKTGTHNLHLKEDTRKELVHHVQQFVDQVSLQP